MVVRVDVVCVRVCVCMGVHVCGSWTCMRVCAFVCVYYVLMCVRVLCINACVYYVLMCVCIMY